MIKNTLFAWFISCLHKRKSLYVSLKYGPNGSNKTELNRMDWTGSNWTEVDILDKKGPNRTNVDIVDQIEAMWTE